MFQVFTNVKFDWLSNRRLFIGISILLMLAGLGSAIFRQWKHPNNTDAFNLGVDFKGGTVVTVRFKQSPTAEAIREALTSKGSADAIIQPVTDKPDTFLVKLALEGAEGESENQVERGRQKAKEALSAFGAEGDAFEILGTDSVGAVAGAQLRNKAIAVTLAALAGMLVYIAFRFEWTYGAAAVIAVFHDVLVTLGFFSIFQWEVSLTVIAALLTLVGASVNDTIVVFDRIRENRRLHRRESLYKITNDSINQTLSRTVITQGLIMLSVLAMVIFGGEVLRGFSLALLIGTIVGTYSSVAIAAPIMVWWEQRIEAANKASAAALARPVNAPTRVSGGKARREPSSRTVEKQSRGAGRA
jgi:preprotein translocase subunit SecF